MFVQIMEGRAADTTSFRQQAQRWDEDVRPGAIGWLGTTAGVTPDGTLIAIARFESEAAARANSARPEQGAWWAETERCFAGPVTFAESSDVDVLLNGGTDDAGFVQVMKGSADRAPLARMDALFTEFAPQWRTDVLGGIRAWLSPTDYVEVMYFTSETAARAGEQAPPPPALLAQLGDFEAMTAGVQYLDITDPILAS